MVKAFQCLTMDMMGMSLSGRRLENTPCEPCTPRHVLPRCWHLTPKGRTPLMWTTDRDAIMDGYGDGPCESLQVLNCAYTTVTFLDGVTHHVRP